MQPGFKDNAGEIAEIKPHVQLMVVVVKSRPMATPLVIWWTARTCVYGMALPGWLLVLAVWLMYKKQMVAPLPTRW